MKMLRIVVLFAGLLLAALATPASAQGCGPTNPNCVVPTAPLGNSTNRAASTAFVQAAIGGSVNTRTANYTVAPTDCGNTIQLGTGSTGLFGITVPAVAGFPITCAVIITNGDTARGKVIPNDPGCSDRAVLWPLQSCTIKIENGAWAVVNRPGRWKPPANTTINFFTDFTNGSDVIGVTDGLGTGVQAFKSAEMCFLNAADQIDFNASAQTQALCNMAAATVDTQGMHSPVHAMVGAQGGAAIQVVGAALSISGAISNGGACEISVPATASYSANQIVSVYGVSGATGCSGTWKVTVTDGTHLTLQGTTFGGAYTSGGSVTNGSSFNTTGVDGLAFYFGTVIQIKNVTISSNQNCIDAAWGSKLYILDGVIFAGSPTGSHIQITMSSHVEIDAPYGIATAAPYHILASDGGSIASGGGAVTNFLPGVNPAFSGAFVYGVNGGRVLASNWTINTNSNTVTGKRWQADNLGLVQSATGAPDTFFPGSVSGSTSGGGQGV